MAREKCGLLVVPRNAPVQVTRYVYTEHVLETGMQSTLCLCYERLVTCTELQKCLLCFPTWNIVTSFCVWILQRQCTSRGVFTRIHQTMRETGRLPSVAVQSEREVVRSINTRENILQMVQRSPRLSTL